MKFDFDREGFLDFIDESSWVIVTYFGLAILSLLLFGIGGVAIVYELYGVVPALSVFITSLIGYVFFFNIALHASIRKDIAKDTFRILERLENLSEQVDELDDSPSPEEIAEVTGGDPDKIRSGMHAFEVDSNEGDSQ
ncbi:hypothetical protein [Natrinema versiforme]|uniref:DUF4282 domain-containing protein n=1 Tax=Natrinema versiforme TaxID=88724 RepID=A0A4P8WP62_9EURY|nr:hypothetical protein [Natrinema versiforme]QCS43881.1 hypothetical protein FEJ81_16575 [Natrinema versiforme]